MPAIIKPSDIVHYINMLQYGGIFINTDNIITVLEKLEELEKDVCSLPMIFSEMFKDEINACDENEIYSEIKKFLKKYSDNSEIIAAVNEFTGAITGGASIEELLSITRDEAINPTLASALTVDETCKLENN